jgi:hypothetical protein
VLGAADQLPELSNSYSTVNPITGVTAGKVNIALQELAGCAKVGAVGKMTTLTVLLAAHAPDPGVPAKITFSGDSPQSAVKTYLEVTV